MKNITEKWSNVEEIQNGYARIREENAIMREEIDILKTVTEKQSNEMETMKSTILDLQARSMRDNVLFHNIKEAKEESCEQKVPKVLAENKYESELSF